MRDRRRHVQARTVALFVAGVVIASAAAHAMSRPVAAQSYPGASLSFYMDTISTATLYDMGCSLGNLLEDGRAPQNALVILAFGQSLKSGSFYGASIFGGSGGFGSTSEIAAAVQQYARGFWVCTGANTTARLRVAVGTSNYGITANLGTTEARNHGAAWSRMVTAANSWLADRGYTSQTGVVGANDIEVSWSGPGIARAWVDAYGAAGGFAMYHFGDAAGCPTSGTTATSRACGGSWTQDHVWYVSYGAPPAYPVPEIYRNDGVMARQWQQVSLYGYLARGYAMAFRASLTQSGACRQRTCDPTLDNTAQQGWTQLYDAVRSDTRTSLSTIPYATDIRWH